MNIRIDPLDKLASQIVRLRAKGHCQRCGRFKEFGKLQAAHCWGRRKKSVRYDLDNMLGICFTCHQLIDTEDPEAKKELFIRYLGKQGYDNLNKRANWPHLQKPDLKAIKFYLETELKKYDRE